MNQLTIIGNLTRDPQMRQVNTKAGDSSVCSFSVAVNRRRGGGNETDYFNVSAWGKTGESVMKYIGKGCKVAVIGPVSCRVYTGSDGRPHASMEIYAEHIEFLSFKERDDASEPAAEPVSQESLIPVSNDDLPF